MIIRYIGYPETGCKSTTGGELSVSYLRVCRRRVWSTLLFSLAIAYLKMAGTHAETPENPPQEYNVDPLLRLL